VQAQHRHRQLLHVEVFLQFMADAIRRDGAVQSEIEHDVAGAEAAPHAAPADIRQVVPVARVELDEVLEMGDGSEPAWRDLGTVEVDRSGEHGAAVQAMGGQAQMQLAGVAERCPGEQPQ